MPAIFRGYSAVAEEGCEMLGIVLFIRALLMHIRQYSDAKLDIEVVFDKLSLNRRENEMGKENLVKRVSPSSTTAVTDPKKP